MSERDFEHEGELTNPEARRAAQKRNAEANRILTENLRRLSTDDDFLLWFQRHAYPAMIQAIPEHGADLERRMGHRNLIASIVSEMDTAAPGFLSRMIAAREEYDTRLRAAEEK